MTKDIIFAYQIRNFLNVKEIQHNYTSNQNKRLCGNRKRATTERRPTRPRAISRSMHLYRIFFNHSEIPGCW